MGALVVLAAQAGAIEPGAEAETVVLIRNTGEDPGEFLVTVRGEAAPWAVVEPKVLALQPGEEAPVWVRFRPPRAPSTRPGRASFHVAVVSRHEPDFEAVEAGSVDVGTFSALRAQLIGEPDVGTRWTELALAVRNVGNRAVRVDVDVDAGGRPDEIEVDPPDVQLPAGAAADFTIRIRPRRRLLPHRARDREVTIAAVSDGGALATIRTELPEEASLANELYRSGRVVALILALLLLGGLALLRSENDGQRVDVTQGGDQPVPLPAAPPEAGGAGPSPEPQPTAAPVAETAESAGVTVGPVPALPKLVFVRTYGPNARDVVVRGAGESPSELRLRTDGASESRPRLSPDGSHVAFIQEQGGVWQVCVSKAAGGGSVCPAGATAGSTVAWSPDGDTLYYSRASALYSAPFDRSSGQLGTERDLRLEVPNSYFALSPDGTRIVHAEGAKLVVRALAGTAGVRVTVRGTAEDPAWSPDGRRLVYTSGFQLFTAPVGDGPIHQITRNGTVNGEPTWSRDGWIVFRSNRSGTGDLYAIRADTVNGRETGLAVLNETPERELTPAF